MKLHVNNKENSNFHKHVKLKKLKSSELKRKITDEKQKQKA